MSHFRIRKLLTSLLVVLQLIFSTALFLPNTASAQTQAWSGRCINDQGVATIEGLECLIANIFIVIITVIGLAGFVMAIIAAFHWMLSGGNTKGLETARNTMWFILVGIVTSLSAFIALNLVSAFTGVDEITRFKIPSSLDGF